MTVKLATAGLRLQPAYLPVERMIARKSLAILRLVAISAGVDRKCLRLLPSPIL